MNSTEIVAGAALVKSQILTAAAGVCVIVSSGWVHGKLSHRWGGGADYSAAAAVLDQFPERFGVWRMESEGSIDSDVLDTLQCANYVQRTFRNIDTSELVRIAVIVGPAGPTAVHTPEICYSSRDYEIDQSRTMRSIESGASPHTFWKTIFKSRKRGGPRLIVYYAWSDGQSWEASEAPRYQFGGSPYLYKVQLAGEPLVGSDGEQDDLCCRFLEDLVSSGWKTIGIN